MMRTTADGGFVVTGQVNEGTRGVVVRHGDNSHQWLIKWPHIEDEWFHDYAPEEIDEDAPDRESAFWGNEIAPLEMWERWPDLEVQPPPEVSPDQIPLFGSEVQD